MANSSVEILFQPSLPGPIAYLFRDGLAADLAVHPEPEEGEERLEEVSIGPSSPARYPFQISEDRCWSHRRWEKLDRVQGRVERPYCFLYYDFRFPIQCPINETLINKCAGPERNQMLL